MLSRSFFFASFAGAAVVCAALAAGACAQSAVIDDPDGSAPPLDVGGPPPDPDAGADASGDAKGDAKTGGDAGKDGATADGGDGSLQDAPIDAPLGDAATSASVRINEIYFDPTDITYGDGAEFVELRGAPGTPVDDLRLRILYGNTGVKYDVAVGNAGDVIGPSGLWVVGGGSVFKVAGTYRVDHQVSLASWGLDGTSGSVQLVRGAARDLVDVVGYGAAISPPATAPTTTLEGATPVPAPTMDKHAIGRKTGAADSNDNAADFCQMPVTPGYPQAACVP
jgi:hypothetical protein